jgi:hypothetical protein
MGVSSSKLKKVQNVDFGSVVPLGLYGQNEDYDLSRIRDLIVSKRISPFYKGKRDNSSRKKKLGKPGILICTFSLSLSFCFLFFVFFSSSFVLIQQGCLIR